MSHGTLYESGVAMMLSSFCSAACPTAATVLFFRLNCDVQRKEAIAYGSYACTNTFLPTAVAAVVLYYGGNLVLQGHMSAGALVSFMLYQQSLTSAFQVPHSSVL